MERKASAMAVAVSPLQGRSLGKYGRYLQKYGIYIGFLAVFVAFSILSPHFLSTNNILNIIVQCSIIAIIGAGQTLVILTGGIDLSVGSIVAAVSIMVGLLLSAGIPIAVALLLGAVAGLSLGLLNGIAVSYGQVPPFIMTLGMMGMARGAALALNGGQPVAGFPAAFEKIATGAPGGVPIFVVYTALIFVFMYFILDRTRFGRHLYAVGGNRQTARLSGVRVKRVETLAYALSGLFAGIGALLLTARLNYATPTAGTGYELDAIAAVVIGGTSLAGGEGGIIGTLVGALLLGMLRNGLTILNVSAYYQQIIIGAVIVGAVFLDRLKERGRE